jgi:hypothetical protein
MCLERRSTRAAPQRAESASDELSRVNPALPWLRYLMRRPCGGQHHVTPASVSAWLQRRLSLTALPWMGDVRSSLVSWAESRRAAMLLIRIDAGPALSGEPARSGESQPMYSTEYLTVTLNAKLWLGGPLGKA